MVITKAFSVLVFLAVLAGIQILQGEYFYGIVLISVAMRIPMTV